MVLTRRTATKASNFLSQHVGGGAGRTTHIHVLKEMSYFYICEYVTMSLLIRSFKDVNACAHTLQHYIIVVVLLIVFFVIKYGIRNTLNLFKHLAL